MFEEDLLDVVHVRPVGRNVEWGDPVLGLVIESRSLLDQRLDHFPHLGLRPAQEGDVQGILECEGMLELLDDLVRVFLDPRDVSRATGTEETVTSELVGKSFL
jgi:hypothetical protein